MARLGSENMSFERTWAVAFDQAEMSPSPEVWTRLDSYLANREVKRGKGRILFFQLVAAASFTMAMGIGIYSLFESGSPVQVVDSRKGSTELGSKETLAERQAETPPSDLESPATSTTEDLDQPRSVSPLADATAPVPVISQSGAPPLLADVDKEADLLEATSTSADPIAAEPNEVLASTRETTEVGELVLLYSKDPGSISDLGFGDIVVYRVPSSTLGQKKAFEPVLWAGVGFSSGRFDPNYGGPGGGSNANAAAQAFAASDGAAYQSESRTVADLALDPASSGAVSTQTDPGIAFSTGFNVGMKVAPRWILESGLNYGNYQSSSQASAFIESGSQRIPIAASNVNNQSLANSQVNFANEFDITSAYEFLSVPMKAGYLVFDRKFTLALFGGVSTDFLLNNRISADDFNDSNVGSGNNNPFRSAYLSGLTGLGLAYTFKRNYIVSLEPGYKIALSSLTKPDSFFRSSPNLFSISLGVRYNFK